MTHLDVWGAAALAVVAAAAAALPAGPLRVAITLPILLLVPGYLLIQALRPLSGRLLQDVLMGLGLSLPVLGLAALLTSIVPGGFTAGAIIAVVTVLCVALAALATIRRLAVSARAPATSAVPTE